MSPENGKTVPLGKMSPFFIERAVTSLSTNISEIKKLRSGDLLIKCTSEADCEQILDAREMLDIQIAASLHKTLNSCRGVVAVPELIDVPVEEILANLKEQQVIDVRKIKIRKNNEYITTRNIVLTFDQPTLPEKLKVGYLSADVRPYIPNPLRCFRCNRFGHAADSCRGSACCARCGQSGHETKECKGPDCCVNCSKDHPAYSRSCSKWKYEKEILHVKVTQNLSYPEARKKVSPIFFEKSFTAAVKQKAKLITQCTQTDLNTSEDQGGNHPPPTNETSVASPSSTPLLSSPPIGTTSMECDDDTSSQSSFTSASSQSKRKQKGGLSGSGSLPDISPKELAAARKKAPRQPIMPPKKKL
ncbi:uncharacterized protein LOC135389455 [Ornithodoros turicata]|uniref:uncharacterized protein LOC135389455 n=1 Tax=Ornithodoros turicata TaxID=34597 RepID=UPI003139F9E7